MLGPVADTLAAIVTDTDTLRAVGKRLVFVSGNFNVIHPGHLRLLRFAAENGDALVVGVNPDGGPGITVPAAMRLEGVEAIAFVTHAFILQAPPEEVIARLKPDVVVKGKEFEGRDNPEQTAIEVYGGRLLFGSGDVRFSSISLLQKEYFETNFSTISKPLDFPARHGFQISDLKGVLGALKGMRILVVGDLIVDTYINCDPLGMSQEDPTIVVAPVDEKTFVGGAGVVAMHAKGLGADVRYVTVVGDDERASFARDQFDKFGVDDFLLVDPTRPTTHKQRYRANGKTLLRVNHLRQHAIDTHKMSELSALLDAFLPTTDLLLFADFNYGCLPQPLVDITIEKAKALGVRIGADSQASSQLSNISRFKDMTLITPTEREARLALQDFESGIAVIAERLQKSARCQNLVITLGAEGLLTFGKKPNGYLLDRLPAFNQAPKDVAGAGDSFFTCTSMALCAGFEVWQSVYLGALAAACQVSRVGNTPLTVGELVTEIEYV